MTEPVLDPRRPDDVLRELLVRRGGFVPTFAPLADGSGGALLRIAADQLAGLVERLNRAPAKRGLALLDLLGVGLVPPQAARAPVVFEPVPGLPSATAPAGTRVGARVPGRDDPLVFETESGVAVCGARLVEVTSVDPGRDAYADHAAELESGRPVTLFSGLGPFAHELYLGHATAFALCGRATVEVDVSIRTAGSQPLALAAAWWDGSAWRPFAAFADPAGDEDSRDGTAGLTRGGVIRLVSACAASKPAAVRGTTSHWIRIAATTPLAPGAPLVLPTLERLTARSIVERRRVVQQLTATPAVAAPGRVRVFSPDGERVEGQALTVRDVVAATRTALLTGADGAAKLPGAAGSTLRLALGAPPVDDDFGPAFTLPTQPQTVDLALQHGLLPDKGVSDGKAVDLTKSFQPFGPSPYVGAALYLACDGVFAKPGTQVTLALRRPRSVLEEADAHGRGYEVQIDGARKLVTQLDKVLREMAAALDAVNDVATGPLGEPLPDLVKPGASSAAWFGDLKSAVATAIQTLSTVATVDLQQLIDMAFALVAGIFGLNDNAKKEAEKRALQAAVAMATALQQLGSQRASLGPAIVVARTAIAGDTNPAIHGALVSLQAEISAVAAGGAGFLGAMPDFLVMSPEAFVTEVKARIAAALLATTKAAADLRTLVTQLGALDPAKLLASEGALPPTLAAPHVAWEFWDGGRWASLQASAAPAAAGDLLESGTVRFEVPERWVAGELAGDTRRWLRARLESGSFARLRLVAWTDTQSNLVNFLPVVEPRPPLLDAVEVFYRCASPTAPPERMLSLDDCGWRDHAASLGWPGPPFAPFAACRDTAPTLYVGFDAPLPGERVGLFFAIAERAGAAPATIGWEAFDGAAFRPAAVQDGTRGLTASGVVHLVWPGDQGGAAALVLRAAGTTIVLAEAVGGRYAAGAELWLADDRGGELVEVAAAGEVELTLARSLSRSFGAALLRLAPPARFGTPRTWLRLRFDADADAPAVELAALRPNAVMAANVQTVRGEILGGSDGTQRQVMFCRRSPLVAGETIEVRESEGARAAVDAPILRDELAAQGREADLHAATDPATGRVTALWVRWRVRDSLAFSDGEARDCEIDRVRGRVLFGDGRFGRIPPAGRDNVRASYGAAGDAAGNVPAGAISSVLSGVLARGVTNPLAAQGGAAGEPLDRFTGRGPGVLRHRRQALTTADYEAMAYEASAAVARARALGAVDADGRTVAGRVRLVIAPVGQEPAPQPTPELRRHVHDLIAARMPATLGDGLAVVGPRYAEVGVDLTVRPARPEHAGSARELVRQRVLAFLHPITGGPGGTGFAFGARLAVSDLARLVHALPELEAVVELAFVVDGIPAGEQAELAGDRLPAAGLVRVSLTELS